ncbi:hypothetical protein L0P50_19645, partial [Lawsonibacter sp. DFI.6.74]|nr:hypothetical protein [Lawsonibacter sp. DFI.6.74]
PESVDTGVVLLIFVVVVVDGVLGSTKTSSAKTFFCTKSMLKTKGAIKNMLFLSFKMVTDLQFNI